MQDTNEDGSSMVGMEQCRISSTESTTSSTMLEESLPTGVRSSPPKLFSQKGRQSQGESGDSCGDCPEDQILSGCGATIEAEPLLPVEAKEVEESRKGNVNKLHFELFDQFHQENGSGAEVSEDGEATKEKLTTEESHHSHPKNVRMKNGSNDTVCTASSSSTTATVTAASTHSNMSSKSATKNSRLDKSSSNKNKRLRHLSTDTDDTSDISATLEPPDGGWGWVVVAASFLVNLIADGVTFSFGVFFMEFQNFFKESESTTAWIGSLLAAMPLLSGPIASWLTDRYGCRNVTIVGGLLAAIGFCLSSYTTSIYVLMFTFGVVTGFGLSLCYVAAVVIVAYYFERRRSFATGLSVCGGGIGTFLFAPISQYLIVWYGWQRTTQILAGAFLSLCACGLLMKDLEWTKKKNKSSNNNNSNGHHHHHNHSSHQNFTGNHLAFSNHQLDSNKVNSPFNNNKSQNSRRCTSAICIPTFVQEQEKKERRQRYYSCNQDADGIIPVKQDAHRSSTTSSRNGSVKQYASKTLPKSKEDAHLLPPPDLTVNFLIPMEKDRGNLPQNEVPLENELMRSADYESNNSSVTNNNNLTNSNSNLVRNGSFLRSCNNNSTSTTAPVAFANTNTTTTTTNSMPTSGGTTTPIGIPTIIIPPAQQTKQSVNSNNFCSSNNNNNTKLDLINSVRYRSVIHRHSLTYRGAVLNLKRYRLRPANSCPDIISVATSVDGRASFEPMHVMGDFCRWIHGVCEWENLVNTRFLLFILSNLLLYTWYDVPYMYLQTAAVRHGYSEDLSSYLISSIGLSNVVGNILLGYLGDKEWASATCVYGVCMIICGGTTVLMPYLMEWSYWSLFTICGVFGLTIAANYALTSVILVQVVSLERFASAYGLLLLVQGIGNLVGPPIAGVISDLTETNTWSFVVAGVGIFISSFFVLAPVFQRELHAHPASTDHSHPTHEQAHVGGVGHNNPV